VAAGWTASERPRRSTARARAARRRRRPQAAATPCREPRARCPRSPRRHGPSTAGSGRRRLSGGGDAREKSTAQPQTARPGARRAPGQVAPSDPVREPEEVLDASRVGGLLPLLGDPGQDVPQGDALLGRDGRRSRAPALGSGSSPEDQTGRRPTGRELELPLPPARRPDRATPTRRGAVNLRQRVLETLTGSRRRRLPLVRSAHGWPASCEARPGRCS
jgi:hypothetical protein